MDWFTWLSQTPLEPSLVYNYGVVFACNELTLNDVVYFDHDFLLGMGIAIAKHRLEILKLAHATKPPRHKRTHNRRRFFIPRLLESLASKFKKLKTPTEAQKSGRSSSKLSSPQLKVEWKEINLERSVSLDYGQKNHQKHPRKYVSGPINGGLPVVVARSPRFSGPLDRRRSFKKSPRSPDQLAGSEAHSPWAMLFDDLKPN